MSATPSTAALFAVQFLLTLGWTIYAAFLPRLASAAGLGSGVVALLLMLDQLLFVAGDLAAGIATDRLEDQLPRLGRAIALTALLSCLAFLLLPHAAGGGGAALIAVTVLWTLSSSALRAPVFALLGKHATPTGLPLAAAGALVGIGVAGAVAPLLTAELRHMAPALPFAVASIALAVAVLALIRAMPAGLAPAPAAAPPSHGSTAVRLALLAGLAALAFQVHANLNSLALFKRFASGAELDRLMPLFWIGFSVAMPAAGWLVRRHGAIPVASGGALLGAAASLAATHAASLAPLAASQLTAGAGWALILLPAMSFASQLGRRGAEGRYTGGLFAVLALLALLRIGISWQQLPADPAWAGALLLVPPLGWAAVALALPLAGRPLRSRVPR